MHISHILEMHLLHRATAVFAQFYAHFSFNVTLFLSFSNFRKFKRHTAIHIEHQKTNRCIKLVLYIS